MFATADFIDVSLQTASDLKQLQGIWLSVAGRCQARLLIAGTHYTFELENGSVYMGTFVIDAESDPRRIDMYVDEGPEEHRGTIAHCIYKFENELLHWCPPRMGSPDNLYEFPSVDDPRYLSLKFERVKPRR
jgi:uncharacterized protein (TIGR03067 family)